jgi:hypothetical protein
MGRPSTPEVASWLSERFARLPDEYESGREQMAAALASHLGCSVGQAEALLDELERGGYLRYAAEGRSVGGGGGRWMIYTSPAENPDDETLDAAVPDEPGKPRLAPTR